MLINHPTGFYKTVLPPVGDNVTYIISAGEPPRGILFFLKINSFLANNSPSLIATEPQGNINSSSLKSFRNNTTIDREPRPIGSILEFVDEYRTLNAQSNSLDEIVDFPRFNNPSTDPVNQKLFDAYKLYQNELLNVSQLSISKQIQIENLERSTNTAIASLQATDEALKVFINDVELLAVKIDLNGQIVSNNVQVNILSNEISVLDSRKNELADSIRRLSKVIS